MDNNDELLKKMIKDAKKKLNEPGIRKLMYSLHSGDRVRIKKPIEYARIKAGDEGIATINWDVDEENPLQEHGGFEVNFDSGEREDFCIWRWWDWIEKIE